MSDNSSNGSSSDSSLSTTHKRPDRKKKRHKSNHHAAPSDYAQLHQHFQFVLPENVEGSTTEKYGSTWQERMVKHFHSHLYKEYVLADLSRVLTGKDGKGGPVGLRWRTAAEVKSGKGFTTCGNLSCQAKKRDSDEEYTRKVRSALGVGVAENGGSVPTGVLLPDVEGNELLEKYLQSCARDEQKTKKKERKRKHQDHGISSKQEKKEQQRISSLPHGLGLHDYEVDFAYVEHNQKKRELVKVRLCLKCAPLIFDGWAMKARLAREKARDIHCETQADTVKHHPKPNPNY